MKKSLPISFNSYAVFILAAIVLIILVVLTGFFYPQEMSAYDWLMRTRPVRNASPEIIVIEIADDTLKSLGRWPIPREYHSMLIDALTKSGAAAIVFDVLFSESSPADLSLAQAIQESGRVYVPYAFHLKEHAVEIAGGVSKVIESAVAGIGHINILVDPDGKVRQVPLWIKHAEKNFPSLGLLAAAQRLGVPPEAAGDPQGALWVNYPGPWTKTFRHVSYIDVLKAHVASEQGSQPWLDLGMFKDKVCFIGLTATGTSDFRANPIDSVYPMVGTQASVCDSFLRRDFIVRAAPWARAITGIALFLIALALCVKLAPRAAFFGIAALSALYTAAVWLIFTYKGVFTDLFLPLAVMAVVYTMVLFRKFFLEAQKRRVLEKELEIAESIQRSFLPPELKQFRTLLVRTFLKPAKFVAGDLYDTIRLDDDTLGVFIGDVSGKGVSAALIMAQAISLLRVFAHRLWDPAKVLTEMNNHLSGILQGRFVTGQYIIIHTREGYWEGACAGHMPLILVSGTTADEFLPASGPPLGLVADMSYTSVKRQFSPGERIFMYTDGWTESRDKQGREFGAARLKEILARESGGNLDELLARLKAGHVLFENEAELHDDITAVALEFGRLS